MRVEDLRATHADQADFCDYSDGRHGWLLSGIKALAEPIEWKGAQGLWNVPAELHRALLAAGAPCPRDTERRRRLRPPAVPVLRPRRVGRVGGRVSFFILRWSGTVFVASLVYCIVKYLLGPAVWWWPR